VKGPTFSLIAAVGLAALAGAPALALAQNQPKEAPSNALQGFSVNRDKPVKIQSDTLEVRDKNKVAIFSGNVHVVQGDTDLRCKTMHVFYEDSSAAGQKSAKSAPGSNNQIKRMECKGGVVVTQKDQVVTGDLGEFDMASNTVTMSGNVVLTKGTDILKGHRLVVNLTTGVSRVESGGGRVEMLMESKPRSEQGAGQPKSLFPSR
jgi:lipopolysaccharide export system protein LptA